jgi:LacI family transcriptional regulator
LKISKKLPTINDVAELSGVSKRTVSRVINGSDKVNEKTRERVRAVIEKLNFRPNRQARGLAAKRSYLLGLVYDLPTLFVAEVQRGILGVCSEFGFELVVHAAHIESEGLVDDVLQFVSRTHVDGLILMPPLSEEPGLVKALNESGHRFVRFTSDLGAEPWKLVVTNYLPAITDMTTHLVEHGHRRFGFISGPRANVSSQMRQEAFIKALQRFKIRLPRNMIVEGAFTYESGVKAAQKLLSGKDRPTAIFAGNDEMALAVVAVASSMGLDVPGDLSVVGFDGTAFSSFVVPSLSTIRRPMQEMAQLGTQKLVALINQGPDAARAFETMVSPQFVPRDSSGPVPIRD